MVSNCEFGVLGQVWYLIVSIPDLCTLTNFISVSVALPHGAVGWSADLWLWYFLIILTCFLIDLEQFLFRLYLIWYGMCQ